MLRIDANRLLGQERSSLGQYMTPAPITNFMASLFDHFPKDIKLLDPGAGIGSLTTAFAERALRENTISLKVDAYEIDNILGEYLLNVLRRCEDLYTENGLSLTHNIINKDFIEHGISRITASTLPEIINHSNYSHCIVNPPYKKIKSNSKHRTLLKNIGIESTNLYSAFLSIAILLLEKKGELVAIVPRSFCNGVYFKPFRELLLAEMSIAHIHTFEARDKAFKEDSVLQENIIIHAKKNQRQGKVKITSSLDSNFENMTLREVSFDKVIKPCDPEKFIHIATNELDQRIIDRIGVFSKKLSEIDINVSTGPVVDFRLRSDIRDIPETGTFPLIYPCHIKNNYVAWNGSKAKKPGAIFESENSRRWLMPNGWYVVIKRFSSKEERRRLVAAIHDPNLIKGEKIGFENHLNIFHVNKKGLDPKVAKGLSVYLNSTLLDLYFRQFSGHTQVNATDLKVMNYPSLDVLERMGEKIKRNYPNQSEIDAILEAEICEIIKDNNNPVTVRNKINEALSILKSLGLPRGQQNDRSALTLLALINIKPADNWADAQEPLMGVTPIMSYIKSHYEIEYAPNTRETIRRQTLHQFVDAGIALMNPDQPNRAINSPKWCYQITVETLSLIRSYGTNKWTENLKKYKKGQSTLAEKYAKAREMQKIPLIINDEKELLLSAGEHSELIKNIIQEFGPRYVPGGQVLYVGDTGSKVGHYDEDKFKDLGLEFDSHGKFPDVVLYCEKRGWLLLIEAVTSHGPVDAKRHSELSSLFKESTAGLVYVTAFPTRQAMGKYLSEICWETEVWVADSPGHLIHFDGKRFLGPY